MSTLFKLPKWATSGSADIVEPSEGKKDIGWVGKGEKPPHETFNWLLNQTYKWLLNLSGGAATYSDLASFIAKAEAGDTGIIKPDIGAFVPLGVKSTTADTIYWVDSDGEYIAVTTPTGFELRPVSDIDTITRTFVTANTPSTPIKAVTNGVYVAVMYDNNYVELFNRDTGVRIWSIEPTTDPVDIAIDSRRVYVCGMVTSAKSLQAFGLADGVEDWSYNHGGTLASVVSDGLRVYAGGAASAAGPATAGSHFVGLTAADGTLEWDVTDSPVDPTAIGGAICTDGDSVWYTYDTGMRRLRAIDGGALESSTLNDVLQVAVDHAYFYARRSNGVYILPKNLPFSSTALTVWIAVSSPTSIYSTGQEIIVQNTVYTPPRTEARLWRRADTSLTGDVFLPYNQLAYAQG